MRCLILLSLSALLVACGGSDLTVGVHGGGGSLVVGSDLCRDGARDGQVNVGVGWQQPIGDGGGGVSVGYGDGSCR